MLESFESQLLEAIDVLNKGLMEDSGLNAYPQLRYLFTGLQINLNNVASTVLIAQRKEIFHGLSQEAKLYEMMTRRSIGIPEGIVTNYYPSRSNQSTTIPVVPVVNYAKKFHKLEDTVLTSQDGNCQASYNTATHEVKVVWEDCDAEINFKDVEKGIGLLSSPLYHEPYTVEFDIAWLEKLIIKPVFDLLTLPKDIVGDQLQVLNGIWFTLDDKGDAVSSEPDNARQLSIVFANRSFMEDAPKEVDGRTVFSTQRGYAKIEFRDYILTFESEDCWGQIPNNRLRISSVVDKESRTSVWQWYRNPLLVKDIRDNISSIIDEMLEKHNQNSKDCPSMC